jgi:hypothetical protein
MTLVQSSANANAAVSPAGAAKTTAASASTATGAPPEQTEADSATENGGIGVDTIAHATASHTYVRKVDRAKRCRGVSRNTVRRYLRQPAKAGEQARPGARRLDEGLRDKARRLFSSTTDANAAALHRLLSTRGINVSIRTVQRAVADLREAATVDNATSVREESIVWEVDLARQIAQRRRTADPDELESDLTLHLAKLQHLRRKVNDWKAFLITALSRRADNWLRNRRRQEQPPRQERAQAQPSAGRGEPHSSARAVPQSSARAKPHLSARAVPRS